MAGPTGYISPVCWTTLIPVEGAERDLALWARARTLEPLTDPEWTVVRHALRQYVASDAERLVTKLVEHAEVVEQVRNPLTVEVEYSDREAVRFECFRENGCTRSTHNWE